MSPDAIDAADWVIWNGSLGIVDVVAIGVTLADAGGRSAFLASPYEIVGPFCLDTLEAHGRIAFGECLVMSRRRWQQDQVELRKAAREKRRAAMARSVFDEDEAMHRETLELPVEGRLAIVQINAAFRRLAKAAHPDAGGSSERYHRIVEARESLLAAAENRDVDQSSQRPGHQPGRYHEQF